MRIGIIGGLDRGHDRYEKLAASYGHELVCHEGWMTGPRAGSLERLVESCDVVVIVTDVNSHGAVLAARKAMRRRGRLPLILRKCGISRFTAILEAMKINGAQAALAS
jgi:Uncharacterized protein conserved in bacteria (DUF2325)